MLESGTPQMELVDQPPGCCCRHSASAGRTVKEGLGRLNTCCAVELAGVIIVMLQPRKDVQSLIAAAGVAIPPCCQVQ